MTTPQDQKRFRAATVLTRPGGGFTLLVRGKPTDIDDIDDVCGAIKDLFEAVPVADRRDSERG